MTEHIARMNQHMDPVRLTLRSRPEFQRFFDGLDMVESGIDPFPDWRRPASAARLTACRA